MKMNGQSLRVIQDAINQLFCLAKIRMVLVLNVVCIHQEKLLDLQNCDNRCINLLNLILEFTIFDHSHEQNSQYIMDTILYLDSDQLEHKT